MSSYIPEKGDFIGLTFDPQSGHEQKGRKPAIVISNTYFNKKTGMALVCPVTNTERRIPLHVRLRSNCKLTGFIMAEQVKSVDFKARKARFMEKAPDDVLDEVLCILDAVIYE